MAKKFLEIDQLIELGLEDRAVGPYRARVIRIDEGSFAVSTPTHRGDGVVLRSGERTEVLTVTSHGLYSFESEVLSLGTSPVRHVVLSMPQDPRRIQRREFVRLDEKLPMKFTCETTLLMPVRIIVHGLTNDISAGGLRASVRVISPPDLLPTAETEGDATLELAAGEPEFNCRSRVIRAVGPKGKKPGELSLEFVGLKELERDRITKYVFARQGELRQRGLL